MITTELRQVTYNVGPASFTIPFHIDLATEIVVVHLLTATGARTILLKDIDYTVDSPLDNITLINVAAWGAGTISIYGDADFLQDVDLTEAGPFLAQAVESALDRCVKLIQQVRDRSISTDLNTGSISNRVVSFPPEEPNAVGQLPPVSARLGKWLRFSAGTGAIEMADLIAAGTPLSQSIIASHLWPQDGDQNPETVNGATSTNQWNRIVISPFRYGAVGDGVADDTSAVQKALNIAQATGQTLHLLGGDFSVDTVTLDGHNFVIQGPGILRARSSIPVNGAILLSLSGGVNAATNQAVLDAIYGAGVKTVRSNVTGSLENLVIMNVKFKSTQANAIKGVHFTRFTRGCRISGCSFEGLKDSDIAINGSWSCSLVFNHGSQASNTGVGIHIGVLGNGTGGSGNTVVVNAITVIGNEMTEHSTGCIWDQGNVGFFACNIWEFNALDGFKSQGCTTIKYVANYHEGNGGDNLQLGGTNGVDFIEDGIFENNHFASDFTQIKIQSLKRCKFRGNRFSGAQLQWYNPTAGSGARTIDCDFEVPDLSSTYIASLTAEVNPVTNRWRNLVGGKFKATTTVARTFSVADCGRILEKTGGAAVNWTIDSNANLPISVDAELEGINYGGNAITLVITTDTLTAASTSVPNGSGFKLRKVATTQWCRIY